MRIALAVLLISISASSAQDAPREHLSPYGLAKPIRVEAGQDTLPAGFQLLKKTDEESIAGKVGVYLPEKAILSMEGRSLSNAGEGTILLHWAKSKTREARTVELRGGRTFDLNEARRVAYERTLSTPWPPKEPPVPNVPKGALVIVGGGGMPADIAKRYIELGDGEKGIFVVLPTSMEDPIKTQSEENFIRRMGAKNVTVIPHREQNVLEDPKYIELLKSATGLWFGGGRQWRFVDAYEGTKLQPLFEDVLKRGGVIGGSSAGATIQGAYLVRGAPAGPNIMMCEGYERGFAYLPGVAIDQHFTARNRFKDMTAMMKTYPQYLGIGLDEATAIVVQGSTAEIMGKGKVHFYDRRKPVKEGEADYEAFPAGTKYDLKERKEMK